jgi:hypothetical protein
MLYGKRDGDVLEGRNVNKGMFVIYSLSSRYNQKYHFQIHWIIVVYSLDYTLDSFIIQ